MQGLEEKKCIQLNMTLKKTTGEDYYFLNYPALFCLKSCLSGLLQNSVQALWITTFGPLIIK